jgi:glycosyltransferase involved in cell wall biosynthesis
MTDDGNNAPLLLDVTRQVWRRWEGVRPTGIDRICDAWLEHFAPSSQAVVITSGRQVILPVAASRALFAALSAPVTANASTAKFRRRLVQIVLRWGWTWLSNRDGKGRVWLNAGHTGLHNPALVDWCTEANVRPVYLIHDLIPITHPEYCRAGEDARHAGRILTVLKTAAGVVANSRHTLDTLADFAERVGLGVPLAIVAWPGSARLNAEAGNCAPANELTDFVVLGTIEARKNHAFLLSVWQRLIATMGDAAPRLVIVGRRGWEADDVFALLDNHDFQGKVVEAGALDDRALASVLGRARALLFPSHAEGFGIPMVEALAAGIPVIANDLPVFREVVGDIPELLAVDDEDAWVAALTDYATGSGARRANQLVRLEGYVAPCWAEHFAKVEMLIKQLA